MGYPNQRLLRPMKYVNNPYESLYESLSTTMNHQNPTSINIQLLFILFNYYQLLSITIGFVVPYCIPEPKG